MPTNVYYSDFAHFAHDPPGHTCGLPCCREDLRVHIKPPASGYSCMPSQEKVLDDNFTFRKKRLGLIQGRPTFSNRFFSLQHINSEEIYRQRMPIPNFGERISERGEGPKSPDLLLSDSLENPFVLTTRARLQQGENICRRKVCLPDSPENIHKLIFADFEPGESLDFEDSDVSEDPTIEYYTTTSQNVIKVETAPIKVLNNDTKSETPVGYNNMGYSTDGDVIDTMTSPEHYYDVLQVTEREHVLKVPSCPSRLYPDLSTIQESTDLEAFSRYKQKYTNTLVKKKLESKAVSMPKAPGKYDTFPRGREHQTPFLPSVREEKLQSFNQLELTPDNLYEDIEIKQHEKTNTDDVIIDDVKAYDDVTIADVIKCDEVTRSDRGESFGTFGYDGNKRPRKPSRNSNKHDRELKEISKRQDSLKDSPITLIL
ncbi:uncharacterized protein LOC124119701 [Haliotis rufescens]|uniref:uncharacterized protein LOC124119701 n=1 Tax=Haliotis rufescens TaxID=6454 RepID=UPI00201F9D5D|nr:uncharacterized protein LOC124119701 [Haliotis rufescens]